MTGVREVFRAAFSGEISVDDAMQRLSAIQRETGAPVSAHDVGEGVSGAALGSAGEPDHGAVRAEAPVAYNPYRVEGDPTPDQYAAMSTAQLTELEAVRPGLADRMRGLTFWERASAVESDRRADAAEKAAYAERLRTDAEFAAGEQKKRAIEDLDAKWWHVSATERARLAEEGGISAAQVEQLAAQKARQASIYREAPVKVGAE